LERYRIPTANELAGIRNLTLGELLEIAEKRPDDYGENIDSFTSRIESYALAVQSGFLTVDEVRKLEYLPKLNGDER